MTGVIVSRATGRGVPNVQVTVELLAPLSPVGPGITPSVVPTTGPLSSATSLTDHEGRWRVNLPAGRLTTARVDVTVAPPNQATYHVRALSLPTSTNAGDSHELGAWVVAPYGRRLATVVYQQTPLTGAIIRFTPTRGVPAVQSSVETRTDGNGIFQLLLDGSDAGEVIGDLQIRHSSLPRDAIIFGFRVPVEYELSIGAPFGTYGVEDHLDPRFYYAGQVAFRGDGRLVPGAGVSFVRTGGVDINPRFVQTVSTDQGFFVLEFHPLSPGTVIGDVTITPPDGQSPDTYRNVQFASYDSSMVRYTGLWGYGYRWAWAVELHRHDQLVPAANVRALFRRTGGLRVTPDTVDLRTGTDGRIFLQGVVPDSGVVEGELLVTPESGPQRLITGLRLSASKASEVQFAGVYGFGPALRYSVQVQRGDGSPIVGAAVSYSQTSGIAASPTSVNGVTDANGRFLVALIPSTDGRVTGTFRVTPPLPWASGTVFTFAATNLDTFESGEIREGPRFVLPSP